MSSLAGPQFYHHPHHHFSAIPQHRDSAIHPSHINPQYAPSACDSNALFLDRSGSIAHAIALLPPSDPIDTCMHDQSDLDAPYLPPATCGGQRQDSVVAHDWQSMFQHSMSAAATCRPLKRIRTHERTPSASTVATQDGPASPFTNNTSFPLIANSDYSPNSPAHYSEQASYAKHLLTPQPTPTDTTFVSSAYLPGQVAHAPTLHPVMKTYALEHNFSDDFTALPDFTYSSRHSMSSGHTSSPATPQSNAGEVYDARTMAIQQNDYRQPSANVQLYRSDTAQAYENELYNPMNFNSASSNVVKRPSDYLYPPRNLVNERIQTANLARSSSPTSAVSRERSPFRDGSPLAPAHDWSHTGPVRTAAGIRQQQKKEAEQAEYAQHMPTLQREPTKTISPKDAVLDYHETEQPPLFQEQIPAGYRQHSGGAEAWPTNSFVGQPGATFGNLTVPVTNAQGATTFRATTNDAWAANLDYMHLPHQETAQISATSFPSTAYAAPRMNYQESNPEFPAQLTSMESSVSDGAPPLSSQNSFNAAPTMQRPLDTRANTGTYTCTYHGCTERFDSHVSLQKHKRDFHRSQQQQSQLREQSSATPSAIDSTSPRSTESPAPSGSGMTSAAILARNSQAGPHKCERINPSTNKPCNTIFSRPYDLTRHEDTIHNNRKHKVRCPYCREEKTFSRNDALTRHMRVVHPEVESYGKRSRRSD